MKEIYNILAGAMGNEERLNMIANNLANAGTVGFKQDHALFQDYQKTLEQVQGLPSQSSDPSVPKIPFFSGGYTDFTKGSGIPTGNPFDLMIDGDGFFEVESSGAP